MSSKLMSFMLAVSYSLEILTESYYIWRRVRKLIGGREQSHINEVDEFLLVPCRTSLL